MASKPPSLSLKDANERELQKVFNQFDADADGKISPAELSGVLSATGSASSPADVRRAMEEIDADKDGFISRAEFVAFCRSGSSSSSEAEIRDAFDLYDRDKNGLISAEELHLVLNRLNARCSRQDCARMIQSVDKDGDGKVNFEEFKRMMAGSIPGVIGKRRSEEKEQEDLESCGLKVAGTQNRDGCIRLRHGRIHLQAVTEYRTGTDASVWKMDASVRTLAIIGDGNSLIPFLPRRFYSVTIF